MIRKIVCPSCQEAIEVNDEKDYQVVCPSCGYNFSLQDGYNAYLREIKHLKNKGYRLYTKLKFEESNECYREYLALNPKDFDVLTRLILNELYQNTYLETNFKKVIPIFEEYETELDEKNTDLFMSFVYDLCHNMNVFISHTMDNAVKDGTFIKFDYLNFYLLSLNDCLDVLTYLDNVFPLLDERAREFYIEERPQFNERLQNTKSKITQELDKVHNAINVGDCVFNKETKKVDVLNENIKVGIEEETQDKTIIVENKKVKKEMKLFYLTCGITLLIGLILLIVGLVIKNTIVTYLSLVPFVGLIIYLIIFIRRINKE